MHDETNPGIIRNCLRQIISNLLWMGTLLIGGLIAGAFPGGGWLQGVAFLAGFVGFIGLLLNLFRLFNRSPRLILSERGIVVPKYSDRVIAWSELNECEFEIKRNNNGAIVSAKLLMQAPVNGQPKDIAISIEGLELSPKEIRTKIKELGGFG